MQKLLLATQRKALLNNHRVNAARPENPEDFKPVIKLFCPWGGATWLLTELEPDEDTAFGLCDLGMGEPELGNVSLAEIRAVRGPGGLYIERDAWFKANKTLGEYAEEAREKGRINA